MSDASRRDLSSRPTRSDHPQMVARCPECKTAFRVTFDQLRQADGRVRCGACYTIFNAQTFDITTANVLSFEGDSIAHQAVEYPDTDLFERWRQHAHSKTLAIESVDESWALSLLEELNEGMKQSFNDSHKSFRDLYEEPPLDAPPPPIPSGKVIESGNIESGTVIEERARREGEGRSALTTEIPSKPTRSFRSHSFDEAFPFSSTEAAPSRDSLSREKSFPWLIINGLLTLGCVAFLIWHQWPSLATHPQLVGVTRWVCQLTGCQVPARYDWSQLSLSFKVRKHPSLSGSLEANALLTNHADFSQPFPWLSLAFSDINGKTLDRFRFSPQDYLKGEMLSRESIPANQSVQIVLSLPDPGGLAVNYHAYVEPHPK